MLYLFFFFFPFYSCGFKLVNFSTFQMIYFTCLFYVVFVLHYNPVVLFFFRSPLMLFDFLTFWWCTVLQIIVYFSASVSFQIFTGLTFYFSLFILFHCTTSLLLYISTVLVYMLSIVLIFFWSSFNGLLFTVLCSY